MSAKTLSLSEEVYARWEAERREGESFNDVIARLIGKKSLMDIVGFFKEEGAEEMEEVIEEMREKSRENIANSRRNETTMILDTTFLIDLMKEDPSAVRKLKEIERDKFTQNIASPTLYELYVGITLSTKPEKVKNITIE